MLNEDIKHKIWACEMQILDVFDDICRKNNLKYSLAYGTLIGAIRHKGFIPWDDDIDVTMPREDYNKLLNIWNQVASSEYLLVNHNLYEGFNQNFSKIVAKNTTFLQEYNKDRADKFPQGFFIDIFPCDRIATNKIGKKLQFLANAVSMLYVRGYRSGTGGAIGIAERILLCVTPSFRKRIMKFTDRYAQKWNKSANSEWIAPCTFLDCRRAFSSTLFDSVIEVDFEDRKYLAVAEYDSYLKKVYGDYMKLPPVEKRVWSHKPIKIDFEYGYKA
ncbi:phosphorylcholine transferase LicD [uncultured Eubacterium sp.]|uniref:LicD family protein n=1 Tax=uncultured Eubacterium sp. TaxID=165185 RepID=UPI002594BCC9|nr:LicD family protein [uncultured Eubacterium sp.]